MTLRAHAPPDMQRARPGLLDGDLCLPLDLACIVHADADAASPLGTGVVAVRLDPRAKTTRGHRMACFCSIADRSALWLCCYECCCLVSDEFNWCAWSRVQYCMSAENGGSTMSFAG